LEIRKIEREQLLIEGVKEKIIEKVLRNDK